MNIKNILTIAVLVIIATSWRIINHNFMFAPNLELVTAVSVLAAIIIGWRGALIVPLATMAISDAVIGTSPIIIATWSSFALIGVAALVLKRFNKQPVKQVVGATGFAVVSSTLFFLITNFGVWLQGFGVYYAGSLAGLGASYAMGLPFYRTMLIGNVIVVPTAVMIYQLVRHYAHVKVAASQN